MLLGIFRVNTFLIIMLLYIIKYVLSKHIYPLAFETDMKYTISKKSLSIFILSYSASSANTIYYNVICLLYLPVNF